MSPSWPWMKNVVSAVVESPIEPVDDNDERPTVADLIEENRGTINKVRSGISDDPLFCESKHDDLWILRFVLSHKKSKPAIAACKETLAFRAEHNLDDKDIRDLVIHKIKEGPVKRYFDLCDDKEAVAHTIPDPQRGVVSFISYGKIDQNRMAAEFPEEDLLTNFITLSEWTFQNLDFITRTTGRLTKTIRLVDLDGFSVKRLSKEQSRRQGAAMGSMENCYPQMLDSMFIVNSQTWMQLSWRVIKPIMPKRVINKIDIINPRGNENDKNRLLQYISEDRLPAAYGGTNEVHPYHW